MSFKCEICSKSFTRLHDLNRHVKHFHPNEYHTSRFECDICDKSYQWKESLTKHKKYKHSNKVKVVKLPKSSITIRNKKVACNFCFKEISRYNMKIHIKRIHQKANLQANQKAYANQQANQQEYVDQASQHVYARQDGADSEVTVVDTTQKVTAVDATADVKPLNDCVAIVDQFIRSITGDQSVAANVIVQRLLKETDKEIRYKPYYYIMIGNVWRQAFECNTEKQFPLLDFIDELTGTVRHDFESQYDFKWMVMMFTMGRELLRIMPSYRREVEEMLLYFLLRADQDLTMLGGWERFNNNCTKYAFPVLTL